LNRKEKDSFVGKTVCVFMGIDDSGINQAHFAQTYPILSRQLELFDEKDGRTM
jgi:hypothetical protein